MARAKEMWQEQENWDREEPAALEWPGPGAEVGVRVGVNALKV